MPSQQSRNIALLAVALLLSIISVPARGEIRGIDSIEWMVADADLVVRCHPLEIADEDPEPGYLWKRVTFAISTTFKGEVLPKVTVRVDGAGQDEFLIWHAENRERLIFLQRTDRLTPDRDDPSAAGYKKYPYGLRSGWADGWQLDRDRKSPAYEPVAYTMGRHVLTTEAEIEASIRAAVLFPENFVEPASALESRFDSQHEAWVEPNQPHCLTITVGISSDWLRVPLDSRIEQLAFDWHAKRYQRELALDILRYFKSDRSIALFRGELTSPIFDEQGYGGPATTWTYPLRRTAYETLRSWGITVPRPEMDEPIDGYHEITLRDALFGAAGCGVVLVALVSLSRRARRWIRQHGMPLLSEGWRSSVFDTSCLVLMVLAAGILLIRWHDSSMARELTATLGGARYWAWTIDRQLTFARAEAWPEKIAASFGSFDTAGAPTWRWDDCRNAAPIIREWRGFRRSTGTLIAAISTSSYGGPGPPAPFVTVRVPLWAVAVALLLIPVTRAALIFNAAWRWHIRRKHGQCIACGYDLRGGHARCPECGRPSAALSANLI